MTESREHIYVSNFILFSLSQYFPPESNIVPLETRLLAFRVRLNDREPRAASIYVSIFIPGRKVTGTWRARHVLMNTLMNTLEYQDPIKIRVIQFSEIVFRWAKRSRIIRRNRKTTSLTSFPGKLFISSNFSSRYTDTEMKFHPSRQSFEMVVGWTHPRNENCHVNGLFNNCHDFGRLQWLCYLF